MIADPPPPMNGNFQYIPEVASGSLNVLFETLSRP
jgi:hypothetical protein